MKMGIVDVGGGLRGIYAAGVFDHCLEEGITFDLCIGVSAGSANAASYIAGQKKRNFPFYIEYPFRKEYMSLRNFFFKKSYLDLDYIYGTLSNSDGENPLDYRQFMNSPIDFLVVATNAKTGNVKYFGKQDLHQDDYSILKASSAIPGVCHPYTVKGVPYFDGALSDTVPIEKAFQCGCDKVVLLLTKPRDIRRSSNHDRKLARMIRRKYPFAAEKLCQRAEQYNSGIELAEKYEAQGRVLIVAPDDTCGVDTLTKDRNALCRLYEKGCQDAKAIGLFFAETGKEN